MIKFNKHFKSSIDQFLENFDKQHSKKSSSQQEEIENASRIKRLMTKPEASENQKNKRIQHYP